MIAAMIKKFLTKRKQAWTSVFKPKQIRGKPLMPNLSAANRYDKRLSVLIERMTDHTEREIKKLYRADASQEYFAQDASISSQARILMNELARKFEKLFAYYAIDLSGQITEEADKSSTTALKESLKQLSGGLLINTDFLTSELDEVLKATIAENVQLIKTIPEKYLSDVQGAVMRSITTGRGLADLVPFLKKHKNITIKRARLIAHDQTRKAFTNINRVRMERMGIKKFEWLHSAGGQHPRPLHQRMSGKIYSFDDPPVIDERTGEKGYPGQLINCRCVMIPVVTFEE